MDRRWKYDSLGRTTERTTGTDGRVEVRQGDDTVTVTVRRAHQFHHSSKAVVYGITHTRTFKETR
jgi:hypothetical protein